MGSRGRTGCEIVPKRKSDLTEEERETLRQQVAERRQKARRLDPDEADAMIDRMVKKSIPDHGA